MEPEHVISRIVEEIRSEGVEFNLDDPFDDPSLCTTAFLDICWQDEHGNSALMLAAAENRVLQVKGILTMAINSGKLWQVIDMRNGEGFNCVDMAVRAGSELCAMLITKVSREYAKHRPRPPTDTKPICEEDVAFPLGTKNVEQLDDNYVKELVRQSSSTSGHDGKKLSRDKLSNNMAKNVAATAGHEYLKMVKRSRSAHSRLLSQRTFSVESESIETSEPSTPSIPQPPPDHGVFSSVGERIRSIFGKKPPVHSKTQLPNQIEQIQSTNKPSSSTSALKQSSYHSVSSIEENQIRLPQHSSSEQPCSAASTSAAPAGSYLAFRGWASSKNTVSTANGTRLPPMRLRRRASSDPKNRNFSSLGE